MLARSNSDIPFELSVSRTLLMKIEPDAGCPAHLQERDHLDQRPPDPINRPEQHLVDRAVADGVDQRRLTWASILALLHRHRTIGVPVDDRPSTLCRR